MCIKTTSDHCIYRKCDNRHYVVEPWLYFKLNIFLQSRLVFHHNFYQLLRLIVTFHFYPPSLSFIHAVIHQVNKLFFLWNSLISPFPLPLWKILCCCVHCRRFSSIPVLYSLEASIIILPCFLISHYLKFELLCLDFKA